VPRAGKKEGEDLILLLLCLVFMLVMGKGVVKEKAKELVAMAVW
jgi:hypothetical protein